MSILEKDLESFFKASKARLFLAGFLVLATISAGVYYLQREWLLLELNQASTNNIAFFIVINLNIILVMALGFLVVRNLIKVFLDRKRNILGAKLKSRLVLAFVGLSLVPTVLLFLIARGMLQKGFNEWFSPQIEVSTDNALSLAKSYYESFEKDLEVRSNFFAEHVENLSQVVIGSNWKNNSFSEKIPTYEKVFEKLLNKKLKENNLIEAGLVNAQGKFKIRVVNSKIETYIPKVNLSSIFSALDGSSTVSPEQSYNGEFLRAYIPLGKQELSLPSDLVLVTTVKIEDKLSNSLVEVINAYDDFRELKSYRQPIASSYLLTLVVVTLLIIFAAIWIGFFIAKELSVPIGLLADGTQQLAAGNLHHRIPETGDDELSVLVKSFNIMTQDLSNATDELLARRNYTETLLESVGVGVVSVDAQNNVTTFNPAARLLLGLDHEIESINQLPSPLGEKLEKMLENLKNDSLYSTNGQVDMDNKRSIHITLTKLPDENGAVVLLDDLTELVSVQRMAAWQEVARRIAHEIKNPLTPIKLSAERILRKYGKENKVIKSTEDQELITSAMDTIVRQVESMRNLVNEFSQFARLPKAKLENENLNSIIKDSIRLYKQNHPYVFFKLNLDNSLPELSLDLEQITRVLVNLIENSINSFDRIREEKTVTQKAFKTVTNLFAPTLQKIKEADFIIEISTKYNPVVGIAHLTVSDNGMGITDLDKKKLFEPYYSFTDGGTGLGLAIVHTIVSDHNGFIRVKDNNPKGAIFIIDLPALNFKSKTFRKLA